MGFKTMVSGNVQAYLEERDNDLEELATQIKQLQRESQDINEWLRQLEGTDRLVELKISSIEGDIAVGMLLNKLEQADLAQLNKRVVTEHDIKIITKKQMVFVKFRCVSNNSEILGAI